MKNQKLTGDEYDALEWIRRGARTDRVNACVGRNAKRLSGLKLVQYARNGSLALTEKGEQVLFLRRCVQALRALHARKAATNLRRVDANPSPTSARRNRSVESMPAAAGQALQLARRRSG